MAKLTPEQKRAEIDRLAVLIKVTLAYESEVWSKESTLLPDPDGRRTQGTSFMIGEFDKFAGQVDGLVQRGSLTTLRQWLRSFTERIVEERDLAFVDHVKRTTGIEWPLLEAHQKNIERIVERGKINTDNEWRTIEQEVARLCQDDPVPTERIGRMNTLLRAYQTRPRRSKPKR